MESACGGEPEEVWLACLFVGNILMQPARLEVVLRLNRVRRDGRPCGCYRFGFVDRLEELPGRYRLFDSEIIWARGLASKPVLFVLPLGGRYEV